LQLRSLSVKQLSRPCSGNSRTWRTDASTQTRAARAQGQAHRENGQENRTFHVLKLLFKRRTVPQTIVRSTSSLTSHPFMRRTRPKTIIEAHCALGKLGVKVRSCPSSAPASRRPARSVPLPRSPIRVWTRSETGTEFPAGASAGKSVHQLNNRGDCQRL
jgi:hypothetical protein